MSIYYMKKKNFWAWLEDNGINKNEFFRTSAEKKEKIFLRWKYGSTMDEMNEGHESTQKYFNRTISDENIQNMQGESKNFWEADRRFEKRCMEYRKEIGIFYGINKDQDHTTVNHPVKADWND